MKEYFITGTDTEVGKTYVTSLLLKYIRQHGINNHKVLGFKPIAAGAEIAFGELVNDDALSLIESSNVNVPYKMVNPYIYKEAIAPHIAAQINNQSISLNGLNAAYHALKVHPTDYILTEGAGGWALPVNDDEFLYDWVKQQNLPVILVVGLKLGCINHALLTLSHMQSLGINCVGWIANHVDPNMQAQTQNIESLKSRLSMPLLAISPFVDPEKGMPKLQVYQVIDHVLGLSEVH